MRFSGYADVFHQLLLNRLTAWVFLFYADVEVLSNEINNPRRTAVITWGEDKKLVVLDPPEFDWARAGDRVALSEYLRKGGNINAKNHKGYSLLMLAAYNDHWSTCAWLLQKGADVNSIDISGNSVLMGICFKGHARIVKLLLSAGADPFLQNCYGMTALDLAKAFGREEVIRILTEDPFVNNERLASVVSLIARRQAATSQGKGKLRGDSLN